MKVFRSGKSFFFSKYLSLIKRKMPTRLRFRPKKKFAPQIQDLGYLGSKFRENIYEIYTYLYISKKKFVRGVVRGMYF